MSWIGDCLLNSPEPEPSTDNPCSTVEFAGIAEDNPVDTGIRIFAYL